MFPVKASNSSHAPESARKRVFTDSPEGLGTYLKMQLAPLHHRLEMFFSVMKVQKRNFGITVVASSLSLVAGSF